MFKISVIIATYNRCDDLKNVLNSLLDLETENQFLYEVLIVDNNSSDATKKVVNGYKPKFASEKIKGLCFGLRYLFEPTQGKSYALNRGVNEAQGEIIAFTDDDALVDSRWLLNMFQCFDKFHCDGVGGRVIPIYPDQTPKWVKKNPAQLAGVVVVLDYGNETKPYGEPMDQLIGSNYAFKRSVFDDCGYFREDLGPGTPLIVGEDVEFISRLESENKSLFYCGCAEVRHPVDLDRLRFGHIARWHTALGRYDARMDREANDQDYTYYFGIPRYLLKGVIQDGLLSVLSIFNRMQLFLRMKSFYRKVGMIQEYRNNMPQGCLMEKRSHG